MRLYLSSFRMGNRPQELRALVPSGRRAAVIANAADLKGTCDREESVRLEVDNLARLGFETEELDLRQYFGESRALGRAISRLDLIWVRGGNVFVLRRALKMSGFDYILRGLLEEDALAYGGYSASIGILTPLLRGLELVDDPDQVPNGYAEDVIWDGLGLLPYAVAPHYKSDHPESADVDKLVQYFIDNHMLFKALRDGEAIVVNGNEERVV